MPLPHRQSAPEQLGAAQSLSPLAQTILRHLPAPKVLLCLVCGFCVVPSQLDTHLARHHRGLSPPERRALLSEVAALRDLAHSVDDVHFPSPEGAPIPGILIKEDCLQCSVGTCQWLAETLPAMQKHCRTEHQWESSKGRGGSAATKRQPEQNQVWSTGHSCQQLFRAPGWKRLTKVQPETESEPVAEAAGIGRSFLRNLDEERRQRRDQRTVTTARIRSQANPWLGHTQWDQHLQGFERRRLRDSLMPGADGSDAVNPRLVRACTATRRLISRAIKVCQPTIVPRSALLYVNRVEAGGPSNYRPFYNGQMQSTLRKYTAVWTKMLCYLWQSQDWEQRPPYVLTPVQVDTLSNVRSVAGLELPPGGAEREEYQEELLTTLLHFWMSLLDHTLPNSEFDSGLLSAVAVLGLDTDDTRWVDALSFTPKLSAIITISRALVVYSAWMIHHEDVSQFQGEGFGLEEATGKARSIFDLVRELVDRCLCLTKYNGQPTPIDRLLLMRSYGRSIAHNTKTRARVSWKADYDEVCIDQVHFSMTELRQAVHGLLETCKGRLVGELMCVDREENLPSLDLARLFDNPGELVEGWSFLDDPRNAHLLPSEERKGWLWDRMLSERHLQARFIRPATLSDAPSASLHPRAVEEYFRSVKQFKEELIVLCHLAAGAPARGPELISIMHQNGDTSRAQRGVFISNGLVELIIPYHKGFSLTQKLKVIHRYLPREVGEVLVYYLWLVEPFVQYLQQATRRQLDFSAHIWEPEPELEEATEGGSSEDEEARPRAPSPRSGFDPSMESSSEGEGRLDVGRAPQRPRIEPLNVDGFWSTNRLKRVMKRELFLRVGVEFSPAQWRQVFPAIQRMHLSTPAMDDFVDQLYASTAAPATGPMAQTQSGHTQWTEDNIYGILATENPLATFSVQRQFRQLSHAWHQFLRFPSAVNSSPQAIAELQNTREQGEANRWARLKQVDLLACLRKLAGAEAQFRGVQHPALQAIVARVSRVVVVMQTGGGKSMLYMLPALCSPESVTIVVVPLNSLLLDQARRCRQAGLRTACWGEHRAVRSAQIVLVTPESAATKAFGRFLLEKSSAGLLDRVVVDECHTLLDSSHGWRPKVLHLSQLAEKGCQLVYLTATLPPADEAAFFHHAGIRVPDAALLREATTRGNIRYIVQECPESELDGFVQGEVQRVLARPGQVVIYCRSVAHCQRFAQLLQCPAFHRQVGGSDEKQVLLDRLVHGQLRVIVATNALGLGIDAPHIRTVIHLGVPDQLRDYAQESGRAGRDGLPSTALAIRTFAAQGSRPVWLHERNLQASVADFLRGHQCRRMSLDEVMDGRVGRDGCEGEEQVCDVCTRARGDGGSPLPPGRKRKWAASSGVALEEHQAAQDQLSRERVRRRAEIAAGALDVSALTAKLRMWQGQTCLVCWALGGEPASGTQSWRECRAHPPVAQEEMEQVLARLKRVHMARFSGCSSCLAPQAVCQVWREKRQATGTRTAAFERVHGQRCQYPGLIAEVAAAVMSQRMGQDGEGVEWRWAREQMQQQASVQSASDWERLWKWVGQKRVSNSIELSELVWLVYHCG